jgi:hypothetical protein
MLKLRVRTRSSTIAYTQTHNNRLQQSLASSHTISPIIFHGRTYDFEYLGTLENKSAPYLHIRGTWQGVEMSVRQVVNCDHIWHTDIWQRDSPRGDGEKNLKIIK